MIRRWLPVFLFLLFFLSSPIVFAQDEDSDAPEDGGENITRAVEATGQAAIIDNDIGRARERATHDALRTAIEKVLGVMIKSQTVVKNSQVIKDEIYAKSEGFALCDDVLDENQNDSMYSVKIRALISLIPLRKKLVSLGLCRQWKIMVVMPETHIARPRIPDPAAETEIIRKLVEAGFYVVDQKYSKEIRYSEVMDAIRRGNKQAAYALGKRYGFDIMIYGEAFSQLAGTQTLDEGGGPRFTMHVCRARVEAKAVAVETAETLSATSAVRSGMEATEELGSKESLKNAGEVVATDLIKKIILLPASSTRNVQVVISGFKSISQAQDFEDSLNRLQGMRGVARSDYVSGIDYIEVAIDTDSAKYLAKDLESSKFLKRFRIRVTSATKTKIKGEIH